MLARYVLRVCFECPFTRMISTLKYKCPPRQQSYQNSSKSLFFQTNVKEEFSRCPLTPSQVDRDVNTPSNLPKGLCLATKCTKNEVSVGGGD